MKGDLVADSRGSGAVPSVVMVNSPSPDAILPKWAGEAHALFTGVSIMKYSLRSSLTGLLTLIILTVLGGCSPPVGWSTDLTATPLEGELWKGEVVVTKHFNRDYATSKIVCAPTLTCRSGEAAEMEVGDGRENRDLIRVKVDTAEDPSTDDMIFTVMVRENGALTSMTSLHVKPDPSIETAMVSDTGSK